MLKKANIKSLWYAIQFSKRHYKDLINKSEVRLFENKKELTKEENEKLIKEIAVHQLDFLLAYGCIIFFCEDVPLELRLQLLQRFKGEKND